MTPVVLSCIRLICFPSSIRENPLIGLLSSAPTESDIHIHHRLTSPVSLKTSSTKGQGRLDILAGGESAACGQPAEDCVAYADCSGQRFQMIYIQIPEKQDARGFLILAKSGYPVVCL